MPRSFTVDPTGSYLLSASELNNTVDTYKIGQATAKLPPQASTSRSTLRSA
jgi:6-phosphogluconolactonase